MNRINKDSIEEILSVKEAAKGLHVRSIAKHLMNMFSDLFTDGAALDYEKVLTKVNRLLLYDVKSRRGRFERVKNPKTKKYRKGYYKMRVVSRGFEPLQTEPKPVVLPLHHETLF